MRECVWSVYVCETRHAKHVPYIGCQSRIAVFVISFYADTPLHTHTHTQHWLRHVV